MSPTETVRNHHPSTTSESVITSCEWITADGFCVILSETREEAPVSKSHENVLLRQRQVSNKANILLTCVCVKNVIWCQSVQKMCVM